MLVHKICKQVCPEKINFDIISKLGDGADGEVFELKDNKVLKLCIRFSNYQNVREVLSYLKDNDVDHFAKVYDFHYLGEYERTLFNGELQKYILHYYIMEKLDKISDDEKKVFHTLLSHEDRGITKNFSLLKIKKMLEGMSLGLDFDMQRVIMFCERLKNTHVHHNDIHPRNIMKDKCGNFKLIDFDRCEL